MNFKKFLGILAVATVSLFSTGCGYNTVQRLDETVVANEAKINNAYQTRADKVGQLVAVVQGSAAHEKETLQAVVDARAKATSITIDKDTTPEQMKAFTEAQKELKGSLSRLLMVAENYPNLKANESFLKLQDEISKTETQILGARNAYIKSVSQYNTYVRQFPVNVYGLVFGWKPKEQLQFEDLETIKQAPKIDFSQPSVKPTETKTN